MKNKNVEYMILVFAVTTIVWCIVFSFIIAKIDYDHNQKIELLIEKCE